MGNYAILTRDITNDPPVTGITGEQISDVTENGKITQDDNKCQFLWFEMPQTRG